MMVGSMAEGATSAYPFPARLEASLSSKCGKGMTLEVPGRVGGLGWET